MPAEAYGVDIRARLQGGREVQSEATGIAAAFRRVGASVRTSGEESHRAGKSYEFATQRLHLFGHAAVGMREHTLGLASAALGVTGAMFGVEEVVKKSVEAWAEQRRITAQTGAVLKSTGGQAGVTAEQVNLLAESLSRQTGIQADQIQASENMMLTFRDVRNEAGKGNDIFTQSTKAAVDMSAAFQSAGKSMSISDAALQLGKALNDPARGMTRLQRIGVVFTQQQLDQAKALEASGDRMGAQKIILQELTKEFGGSAAAVATPGAKLHATIHQLEETFGRGLQPAIDQVDKSLIHLADKAAPGLSKFSNDMTAVFNDPHMDLGQKLSAIGRDAKLDLGPFAHQFGQQLKQADIGGKVEQALQWAAPRIADASLMAGQHAVVAFVKGFTHANLGEQLIMAWFVGRKLGLWTTAGRSAGARFGGGFAQSAAAGEAVAGAGGVAGTAGRVGKLGRLATGASRLAGPEGFLAIAGVDAAIHLGYDVLGPAIFGDHSVAANRAASERRLRAAGQVHTRLANGTDVFMSPTDAAREVHLHHATILDGKVIAQSTTKHSLDAAARKG